MMLAGKTLSEQPLSVQPFLTCLHTAANHRTEVGRGGDQWKDTGSRHLDGQGGRRFYFAPFPCRGLLLFF